MNLETVLMAAAENEDERDDIHGSAYYLAGILADHGHPLQPLVWGEQPVLHLLDLGGPYRFLCAHQPDHPCLVLGAVEAKTPGALLGRLFG